MAEGSGVELQVNPVDQGRQEAEPVKEHPLEGGILIHGFDGNIGKPEEITVAQVITRGALVSPSRRTLNVVEQDRYQSEIPRDYNRINFMCWKTYGDKFPTYTRAAFWAGPLGSLENYYLGRDSTSVDAIYALGEEGVEIPIERGLLFISDVLLFSKEVWASVEARAKEEQVLPRDIVKKYMVVLPSESFPMICVGSERGSGSERANQLLTEIQKRITHAVGVSVEFEQNVDTSNADVIRNRRPATSETLGLSTKIEGDPLSDEIMRTWNNIYDYHRGRLDEIVEKIEEDPFQIEDLYSPVLGWEGSLFFVHQNLEILDPESKLLQKIKEAEQRAQEALKKNQHILQERFPNMPILEREPGFTWDTVVYKDAKTGNVRVYTAKVA